VDPPSLCWTPSWGPRSPLPALTKNLSFFSGGDFLSQPEHTTCPPSMARAQQHTGEVWRARSRGLGHAGVRMRVASRRPPLPTRRNSLPRPQPEPQALHPAQGFRPPWPRREDKGPPAALGEGGVDKGCTLAGRWSFLGGSTGREVEDG
jgi:hypothetical protein